MTPPPPSSTLFPYTTLFRSHFASAAPASLQLDLGDRDQLGVSADLLGEEALELGGRASQGVEAERRVGVAQDRKSTRLNSSHTVISYAVFCLKKKNEKDAVR